MSDYCEWQLFVLIENRVDLFTLRIRRTKQKEMSFEVELGDFENKVRCAEVFLTNTNVLELNCLTCETSFIDFVSFREHVLQHFSLAKSALVAEDNKEDFEEFQVQDDNIELSNKDSYVYEENEVSNLSVPTELPIEIVEEANDNNYAEYENVNKTNTKEEFWTVLYYEENDAASNNDESSLQADVPIETMECSKEDDSFEFKVEPAKKEETVVDYIVEENANSEHELDLEEFLEVEIPAEKIKSTKKLSRRKIASPNRMKKVRANNSNSERKHKCPICAFAFTDKSNLNSHIRRHGNNKNHACSQCDKRFFTRTELETHVRYHTGERPYICAACGKGCLTAGELNIHERRHTNDRRYKCEYCEKSFYNNKHLKDHMLTHTQDRKHVCHICNSRFLRRKSLTSHLKIHENKREYVCTICGNAYNQRPALCIHIKSKHGIHLHASRE